VLGQGRIVFGLGRGALGHKGLDALQVQAGQMLGSFQGPQTGLLLGNIELHQDIAGLDAIPRVKVDTYDLARHLCGQGHALDGGDGAHGADDRLPRGRRGIDRGNHRRRHGEGFVLGDHGLDLHGLDPGKDAGHDCHEKDGEKNFLEHDDPVFEVAQSAREGEPMQASTCKPYHS